jgi:hypothetical protein
VTEKNTNYLECSGIMLIFAGLNYLSREELESDVLNNI